MFLPPNLHLEKDEKLIIAPRHPERFLEVENLLKKQNIVFEKFTSLNLERNDFEREFKTQVLLLDFLGELINFYAISDVVVLGGSFIEGIGGHNPIEAAYFDNVLISGKYIHNQEDLFQKVENVIFCENLKEISVKIHSKNQKVKIKEKQDLNIIIQAIKEGFNAGKSL